MPPIATATPRLLMSTAFKERTLYSYILEEILRKYERCKGSAVENPERNHQQQPRLTVSRVAWEHASHLPNERNYRPASTSAGEVSQPAPLQSTAIINFFFIPRVYQKKPLFMTAFQGLPTNKAGRTPALTALFALKSVNPKVIYRPLNHCSFMHRHLQDSGRYSSNTPTEQHPSCTRVPLAEPLRLQRRKRTCSPPACAVEGGGGSPPPAAGHAPARLPPAQRAADAGTACFAGELVPEPFMSG